MYDVRFVVMSYLKYMKVGAMLDYVYCMQPSPSEC